MFYANRFRYRLQASVPLNKPEISAGAFFAVVNDEIWVNFGKEIRFNVFDQNRAYAGFGYQINKVCNIIGIINQRPNIWYCIPFSRQIKLIGSES